MANRKLKTNSENPATPIEKVHIYYMTPKIFAQIFLASRSNNNNPVAKATQATA